MEALKEYPNLLKVVNLNRLLSGENRLKKNLSKICKNYWIEGSLEESVKETLEIITEREFCFALLIELVDDSVEYSIYKNKTDKLSEYLQDILKTYNSIKKV